MKRSVSTWLVLVLLVAWASPRAALSQPPKPKDGPLGMKFVQLPKGTTYLGWNGEIGSAKKTEIKEDFEIAIYTVTQGQWQELMGKNPSAFSHDGFHKKNVKDIKDEDLKLFPVETVSWNDVQEFLTKLNEKEKGKGYLYRLPTIEEWEYACRGGATTEEECSYHFYFDKPTNDMSSIKANFDVSISDGKGEKGPFLCRTTKVGSYAPNKLGLYDMHGNVWQFVSSSSRRGLAKGGFWFSGGNNCRASYIGGVFELTHQSEHIGFRLARVPVR